MLTSVGLHLTSNESERVSSTHRYEGGGSSYPQ